MSWGVYEITSSEGGVRLINGIAHCRRILLLSSTQKVAKVQSNTGPNLVMYILHLSSFA